MRKIKYMAGIGLVGCKVYGEIEVLNDATEAEIDLEVFEHVIENHLDYSWTE